MQQSEFRLPTSDGTGLFVRSFLPERTPRAILLISHGMAEHSLRYARFAQALSEHGYGAYANDHRGHGYTVNRREDLGHFADEGGWEKVVADQLALLAEIKARHPGVPVFLFGHSMGSFVARSAALRCASELTGLLLSGTTHDAPAAMVGAGLVAKAERMRLGKRGKSSVLRALTFGAYNKKFEDPRTPADWLSRDPFEVDKYVADPLCGYECTTQLFVDMFAGMQQIFTTAEIATLPKSLPIYILAGELDPLNGKLSAIKKLHKALETAGLGEITLRVYPGARHELLNETNRDEVTRDVIEWLDARLAQTG
ncbi:MAG TPA: alpha/beta hydrolase [Polyangiales bacterium]|nr:alpha/beta hydrolase [Polyangiales bacterium]